MCRTRRRPRRARRLIRRHSSPDPRPRGTRFRRLLRLRTRPGRISEALAPSGSGRPSIWTSTSSCRDELRGPDAVAERLGEPVAELRGRNVELPGERRHLVRGRRDRPGALRGGGRVRRRGRADDRPQVHDGVEAVVLRLDDVGLEDRSGIGETQRASILVPGTRVFQSIVTRVERPLGMLGAVREARARQHDALTAVSHFTGHAQAPIFTVLPDGAKPAPCMTKGRSRSA